MQEFLESNGVIEYVWKTVGRLLNNLRNNVADFASISRDVKDYCQLNEIPTDRRLTADEQAGILEAVFQKLTERIMNA